MANHIWDLFILPTNQRALKKWWVCRLKERKGDKK